MDPYIGEIRLFAGSYAPMGWAFCNGQTLNVQQNTVLYSVIGNTFGGNPGSTFNLPDLRGRVPIHQGEGQGLTQRNYATSGGNSTVSLTLDQIPNHTHTINSQSAANEISPAGTVWANGPRTSTDNFYSNTPDIPMNAMAATPAGGNQPHNNMQPYLVINYIIALEGVYPLKQ